jgi:predicted transcriptional regulator
MGKATFSLDAETLGRLRRISARLAKPQSLVVREAIREYEVRRDKLTEDERQRLLEAFDRTVPAIPARPLAEVEAELTAIRRARRGGGRRHRVG